MRLPDLSTMRPPRIALTTLGCRVNQSETETLARQFTATGCQVVPFDAPADVYVVNTCTVTQVGDRKSRQLLRRAARRNPQALVVAAGCYATVDPATLQAMPEVGLVVPNAAKSRLPELVLAHLNQTRQVRAVDVPSPLAPACFHRTRALVKVQDGCAEGCAYCIVPRARGAPRSRPLSEVLAEVQARVAEGHQEVVLTGIHLGQYGLDLGPDSPTLADLIRAILGGTNVPRLRLSSIEPPDFQPTLLELWQNPRLCRHLALPLQSGCDRTLARMGRRYTSADYARLLKQLRAAVPQIAITTDVIVGFPGETDADHAASLDFAREMAFARIHVFPYSRRQGTPAATMSDQVDPALKQARASDFRALGEETGHRYRLQFVGQQATVLWETPDPDRPAHWVGFTDTYIRVTTTDPDNLAGRITPTLLTAVTTGGMTGQVLR